MKVRLLILLVLLPKLLEAQRYDITAGIGQIRYHEASNTLAPQWGSHVWFGLINPDQNPNCKKYQSEYVVSVPQGNDAALSILLSAKLAQKTVVITIDDDQRFLDGQYCRLQYITIK